MSLCACCQRPRAVGQGAALCRCKHLVWRRSGVLNGLGGMFRPDTLGGAEGMSLAGDWQPVWDPKGRKALIRVLRAAVDLDEAAPPNEVRAAVEAARIAGEREFANELDFAHWVASLEV